MSNSYFQFKQFSVWHDKCAMKVGTDGVLLGAWAPTENSSRILDIGTGTGLVALMLAQRNSIASITALEIDDKAAQQAVENVGKSPWKSRIEVVQIDFKSYLCDQKFDLIVSNPPYFVDSLKCPNNQRSTARHGCELNYEDLLQGVCQLLAADGAFTLIIPTDVSEQVKELALANKLYPSQELLVITKPGAKPKRSLITFTHQLQVCQTEELLTEISRHCYSPEYTALTQDFYLRVSK